MLNDDRAWHCRVCGLRQKSQPWGMDGKTPSFEICDCCGVEFGYEDASPQAAEAYRRSWLARGAPWFHEAAKPSSWDLEKQLAFIGTTS
ncbi:MAG: hypothetical protein U1A78_16335 [Polyangia bacterium]